MSKWRSQVLTPEIGKPLKWPLQGTRRVHVLGSFVLIYKIVEDEKIIKLVRFAHHDDVYKCW